MVDVTFKTSTGENLLLKRRRLNLNQEEAAKQFGVSIDQYAEWESDLSENGIPPSANRPPKDITDAEKCVILRRRAGSLQKDIAKSIGCSRLWVIRMEKGKAPVGRLREYWGI